MTVKQFVLAIICAMAVANGTSCARRPVAARALSRDGVLRVVVLGDSLARGAGDERGQGIPGALDAELCDRGLRAAAVMNLGINGARTCDIRRLMTRTTAPAAIHSADVIVLSIGGNDLYGDSSARLLAAILPDRQQDRTLARVQRIVRTLRHINPAARIYLLGLYNPYRNSSTSAWLDRQVNRWDSRLIAQFAGDRQVTVIRICDLLRRDERISTLDRFHPSAKGYAAIAERIAASIGTDPFSRHDAPTASAATAP